MRSRTGVAIGVFLILAGVLVFLQNLGVLAAGAEAMVGALFGLLFAAGGIIFLLVFLGNRESWWALIPGFTLLGLGLLVLVGAFAPGLAGGWLGGVFLGMIGLSFLIVFLVKPDNWWAIIPGGTLLTLAVIATLAQTLGGLNSGGVFFLGMALTFGLVYLAIPAHEGRSWALIPAGIMAIMGLGLLAAAVELVRFVWPLALLAAGCYLLLRALRRA